MGDHTHSDGGITDALLAAVAGPAPSVPAEERIPFPLVPLPPVLRQFVKEASDALGVAPECVATPAIATCATAIGNTYRLALHATDSQPSVIWAAMLLEGGSVEMQAYRAAMSPLVSRQQEHDERYQYAKERQSQMIQYKKTNPAQWRIFQQELAERLIDPVGVDLYTSKCSVAELTGLLSRNPRGLALVQDDLSGLFTKLNPRKGQGGNDEADFLRFYQAQTVKRHGPGGQRVLVPAAAVSILGTCPPAVFLKAIVAENRLGNPATNLLAARFLLVAPEPTPRTWRESTPFDSTAYRQLVHALLDIPFAADGVGEWADPILVHLRPEAKERYTTFMREHEPQTVGIINATLRCHYANLPAVAARLALIFWLCDKVSPQSDTPTGEEAGGVQGTKGVEERHMLAGIALARWFGHEATRIYGGRGDSKSVAQREQRELLEAIRKHGGSIRPWEMRRLRKRWSNSEIAEKELRALERAGFGVFGMEPLGPKGGRPAYGFKLHPQYLAETLEKPEDSAVCVSAVT